MKNQTKSDIKVCNKCVLPESFPGIRFDDKGICNYCLDYQGHEVSESKKLEYSKKFDKLVKENKGKYSYDVLMCYSGGKDSTYTMSILKRNYGLNILALSFDNGFFPEQTLENIRSVVETLGIDHIVFKPRFDILAKIFLHSAHNDIYPPKALERSSAVCTSCMGVLKYTALRLALEKDIPMISYGWSPGQAPITSSILPNNPQMVKSMQNSLYNSLYRIVGDDIKPYFLQEKHFSGSYQFPCNVNPLSFLEYNIDLIYERIASFGWKKPEEVDANSTNCLLNSYANYIHKQKLDYHPYAAELSNLIREGKIRRDIAIQRLNEDENPDIVARVEAKLNLGSAK